MYLTDYREYSLKDVITQLEPGLFKRVTGLEVKDFELLVSLGVFNGPLMNDAVYKFKRYEDSSLSYTGINKHAEENVGGYDTVITSTEYKSLYGEQQLSMNLAELENPNNNDNVQDSDKDIESKSQKFIDIKSGDLVKHKKFGFGSVKSIDNEYVIVIFKNGEKRFRFPDSFTNGFLSLT